MASRVQPITGGTLWQNEEKHVGMSFIFQYRFACLFSVPLNFTRGNSATFRAQECFSNRPFR